MKLIFGLGNPSNSHYKNNRHNVGKLFIDYFLLKHKNKLLKMNIQRQQKYIAYLISQNLLVCKSQMFMNMAGNSIKSVLRKYPNIKIQNILITQDDLDHNLGFIGVKNGGSAEGHNGVTSVIEHLKTNQFKRLKFGISRPRSKQPQVVAQYVLTNFSPQQIKIIQQSFEKGCNKLKELEFLQ